MAYVKHDKGSRMWRYACRNADEKCWKYLWGELEAVITEESSSSIHEEVLKYEQVWIWAEVIPTSLLAPRIGFCSIAPTADTGMEAPELSTCSTVHFSIDTACSGQQVSSKSWMKVVLSHTMDR